MTNTTSHQLVIHNIDGEVIQRSHNLRGVRRYVGRHVIRVLAIDIVGTSGEGKLLILFEDGGSFETNFACCDVLRGFVRRWRNVYGAPLRVHGEDEGTVSYSNPALS